MHDIYMTFTFYWFYRSMLNTFCTIMIYDFREGFATHNTAY